MKRVNSFFGSTYTKIAVGVILVFFGIASGIYVGFGLMAHKEGSRRPQESTSASLAELPETALRLHVGDAFPLETYADASGQEEDFESLLGDQESIVLFGSVDCEPCLDLLRYVQQSMLSRLKPGVQVVLLIDRNQWPFPEEYKGLTERLHAAVVNGDHWRETYHWTFSPIVMGVDNSGIIRHIQYGYEGAIDHELVEYHYSK